MKIALWFLISASTVRGFIPPVSALAKEAVEGRRSQPYTEMVLRHHLELRPGEAIDLEEQWIGDSQRSAILFKVSGGNVISSASYEKRSYGFPGSFKTGPSSGLFLRYLLTTSSDDLLGGLMSERFIRRDHLTQFKQGFEPKGDPQSWDVKENYVVQEGVFLRRARSQPAFTFTGGGSEDLIRSVFFSKESSGILRLEWKRGSETYGWNFDGHTRFQSSGTYPKQMTFERQGQVLVTSELLVHRPAKDKQFNELKKFARTAPPPSGVYEDALRILLSYR